MKWTRRAISACHLPPQDQKGRHTAGKELFRSAGISLPGPGDDLDASL